MPAAAQPAVLTEAVILDALRDCYHPELSLSVAELGMAESIAIAPDPAAPGAGIAGVPQRVRIRIALVSPSAAAEATSSQIAAIIRNRLAAFEAVGATEVALLDSPAWSPERMSPEARATMEQRIAQRIAAPERSATPEHGLIQIK